MPRPPRITPETLGQDVASLQRVYRRITSDKTRSAESRRELGGLLLRVIEPLQKEMLKETES